MSPYPGDRCQRLYRDVGDDSPWYEKALFHALSSLWHEDDPQEALRKIEETLAERPSEQVDPQPRDRP